MFTPLVFWATGLLVATQVLGGGTRQGFVGDLVVSGLGAAVLARWVALNLTVTTSVRSALVGFGLGATVVTMWLLLKVTGGVSGSGTVRELAGQAGTVPSALMTVSPYATGAAVLSLLAPVSAFVAARSGGPAERLLLAWLLVGLGALSLGLGFLQMAQGPDSPLRLFEFTNVTEAVGFFANRNHFAAQLYVTLILAAVWVAMAARGVRLGRDQTPRLLGLTLASVLLLAIVSGLALARSRAGVFLAMAALVGVFFLLTVPTEARQSRAADESRTTKRLALVALGGLVLFILQFGLTRILTRFEGDPFDDLRWPLAAVTWETAKSALPFGTGLGTFVPVYAAVERTADLLPSYANRAHNDLLEVLLETGVAGLAALLLFVGWLVWRTVVLWAKHAETSDRDHVVLQRACTLILWLLLAHSLVDYPLRTTALAVVFAFCAGVLVAPPDLQEATARVTRQDEREQGPTNAEPSGRRHQHQAITPSTSRQTGPATSSPVAWPEAWRRSSGDGA